MSNQPKFVTKPFLPPLEEFIPYMQKIWETKILTNEGPFHQDLERELCKYLGVKYISLFCNGTIALTTALQALRVTGEVITTPFSFVATSHSLVWNFSKPVFVDIDPKTLNMDPSRIESAITPHTTAIMPVHCYGNRCDVDTIKSIAETYNLKVIYDAAHAFGVKDAGGSILRHGDLSVLSFHATKVFNTFEGGAIVSHDAESKRRIDQLKNFGFVDEVTIEASGINGKMSEINSAMGLLQLKYIDDLIAQRQLIHNLYSDLFSSIKGIVIVTGKFGEVPNYSYFPILIKPDFPISRDQLYNRLKEHNIFTRRYFYPLISDFPIYAGLNSGRKENLPVAKVAASNVLCLPIFPGLTEQEVQEIVELIKVVAGISLRCEKYKFVTEHLFESSINNA